MILRSIANEIYSTRMSQCFLKLYERSGENVKVELDLSHYAMKAGLDGATGIDTYTLVSRAELASLKTKVDDLNLEKIRTFPADFSKLSNIVRSGVVRYSVYNQLFSK